jgi:hypothetical protein
MVAGCSGRKWPLNIPISFLDKEKIMAKKNKTNKTGEYTKTEIINLLALRRVTRYSDGKRVWISAEGKEFDSVAQAAKILPQKGGEK